MHKLQADGKLIEASQKVTEAQKAAARFGPDEESPDMVAQQLRSSPAAAPKAWSVAPTP